MQVTVNGETFPVLEVQLQPGDRLFAEPGEFSWMTSSVRMKTSAKVAGAQNLFGAVKRAIAGGGLFMTEYTAEGEAGSLAFAAKVPGQIVAIHLTPQSSYLVHRHGFLCGTAGIEIGLGFQQSFTAGLFGGSGFIMQRLGGSGEAWVELGGQLVVKDLAPGEVLLAHPGHVGMFQESVTFDITTISGIRNMFFGGNGIFVARLRGPGKVWLQSLTLPNLAHALSPYMGGESGAQRAEETIGSGVVGALVRGLFK